MRSHQPPNPTPITTTRRSQTKSSVFIALCWSAWTVGLALICAVVFAGQGGPLKALLELPFWSPLARLTFSTYLVHPMVILVVISSRNGMPAHFRYVCMRCLCVGAAVCCSAPPF